MRVTSSPAPAVTTAVPSRWRSTVPPPMSITNGVVPARGVVPAPSTAARDSRANDVRAARRARGEHLQQAARVAPGEHGERERAPALQAAAQARILGRLRQAAPERVQDAFVSARRAAQRGHRARRGRRLALVEHRARAVGEEQAHGRVDRLGRRAGHARLAHDERRAPAGDRARGVTGRARLVRPEAEQLGQPERVARARSRSPPARRPRAPRARRAGRIAASGTSSTIGRSRSKRLPISTASSPCTITPAMRWPCSRAAHSRAAASSKSSSSTIASTVRGRRSPSARRSCAGARRPHPPPTASRSPGAPRRCARGRAPPAAELDEAGVDGVELGQQQAVNGSPSRRSARARARSRPRRRRSSPSRRWSRRARRRGSRARPRRRAARRRAPWWSCRRRRPRRARLSPSRGEPAAHVRAARLAHERGAQAAPRASSRSASSSSSSALARPGRSDS